MKPRILLLEDVETLRNTLSLNLELEGYTVEQAGNGREALNMFDNAHYDLLLLDVMVPDINGHQVCEHIRVRDQHIPILFLSALNLSSDRIKGLKHGADDYLAKPIDIEELFLKVERLLRKVDWFQKKIHHATSEFTFGQNSVNFETYEAMGSEGRFMLTKKEAALMRYFCENANEVLPRERILHSVWGYSAYPNSRSIDNFVLFLRQKFEADTANPRHFISIRGVGYRFAP